jgi:hypothetical protein
MPIRWSALKVKEAADMIEECFNQAAEPLEQVRVIAQEARRIPNIPEYVSQYLYRIEGEVSRAIGGSQFEPVGRYRAALENLRKAIPEGTIQTEQDKLKHGTTTTLL